MNNSELIKKVLRDFYVSGKEYHSQLPEEIQPWYCYTSDGGHNILCVLEQDYHEGDCTSKLVPIPVKTVLKQYSFKNNYVVVNCKYDSEIGLIFDPEDEEF